MHQADQSIQCPGCKAIFTRAANLIAHLEQNKCSKIRAHEFRGYVQQKHVVNEIMKEPDAFVQNLQVNQAFAPKTDKPGLVTDGTEGQDQETEGGVPLMDQEDDAQKDGHVPLQAEVDLIDFNHSSQSIPLTRAKLETWPRLPGQSAPSQPSETTRSTTPSVSGTDISISANASDITSRRGGTKVYTESYSSLGSPAYGATSIDDNEDAASEATTTAESAVPRTAWAGGQSSKTLFAEAKPTPPSAEALARQDAEASSGGNLFTTRFWDKNSKDYDVERFYHSVLEKYVCPFPGCETDPFDAPIDIEEHLLHNHTRTQYRCPACLKLFDNATGLVAHCEANGRCKVKESSVFKKMLDDVTGGFLKAKRLEQPKIYRPQNAMIKAGGLSIEGGVMSTLYKAKMPYER